MVLGKNSFVESNMDYLTRDINLEMKTFSYKTNQLDSQPVQRNLMKESIYCRRVDFFVWTPIYNGHREQTY